MDKAALSAVREELLNDFNDLSTISRGRLIAMEAELHRVCQNTQNRAPVVELGTYRGLGAVWIRSLLDAYGHPDRELHVYDSFQGVPRPSLPDGDYLSEGEVSATPDQVLETFDHFELRPPIIHPGWFSETLPHELPSEIGWAYIDCDLYEPMLECLAAICPRLITGGSLLVDDYADTGVNPDAWDGLPGVYTACVEFFQREHPLRVIRGGDNLPYGSWDN